MVHATRLSSTAQLVREPHSRRPRSVPMAALGCSWIAALGCAVALSVRLASLAPGRGAAISRVDQVIELGVLAVGVLIAWWLTAGLTAATLCAGARALGGHWSTGERFVARHAPAIVRRGLALTIGAGVGLAAAVVPAGAQPTGPPADLGWVATQVAAPVATDVSPEASADEQPPATPPDAPDLVTVQPGDALWTIAASRLPAGTSDADIAAAWPRWFETNRELIGDDPDRIEPGQVLTAPSNVDGGARS